jgi:hypothetical protein
LGFFYVTTLVIGYHLAAFWIIAIATANVVVVVSGVVAFNSIAITIVITIVIVIATVIVIVIVISVILAFTGFSFLNHSKCNLKINLKTILKLKGIIAA